MKTEPKKIDVINSALEDCIMAYPVSSFVISIYQQYQQRGWLTRKQLEGLYQRLEGIRDLPPGKLAALEAIIRKMPVRQKSDLPASAPLYRKDEHTGHIIDQILARFPHHKRVLYFRSKYENNETLSAAETSELMRFKSILKV